jgi:nicotinate-nucleotide adenylyltransferase
VAWLLGADAFRHLHQWHRWRELFGLAHLVVAVRPGHALDRFDTELETALSVRWIDDPAALSERPNGYVLKLAMPPRHEAASSVRARIASGLHWGEETPPAVAAYIRKYGLYAHPGR